MQERLEDLDLHPRINAHLKKANIQKYDVILSTSGPDLQRSTQLSARDVNILHQAVAKVVYKQGPVTALEMYQKTVPRLLQRHYLTIGCTVLDDFLKGGLPTHALIEIAGESASGKTQLCMQLCLTVQLPRELGGLNAGAVYLCTEDVFPNRRLQQMADRLIGRSAIDARLAKINFTDHIFIKHVADLDDLRQSVEKQVPLLLSQARVKLIVIDSIAALFRCEYTLGEMRQRAKQLSWFASHLHKLATRYSVPVVCVNQVSDVVGDNTGGRKVTPALGLAWAHQVTMRLMVTKTTQCVTVPEKNPDGTVTGSFTTPVRTIEVLFAPHLPPTLCNCIVDADGVKGLK